MPDQTPRLQRLTASLQAFCQEAAQVAFLMGAYAFILSAFLLPGSKPVTNTPFAVGALCMGFGLTTHALMVLVKRFPWLLPSDFIRVGPAKAHKWLVVAAIIVPLGVSWAENETLYGAINPIGYWREQVSKHGEERCTPVQSLLAIEAERAQVALNKYNLGIATSSEVKVAAASLKAMSELYQECVNTERERYAKAASRLKELEQ